MHIIYYSFIIRSGKILSKKFYKPKFKHNKTGLIITAIGVGVILCVILPLWGWILVVGVGLIYIGWCIMEKYK